MMTIDGKSEFCNELYCIVTILLHCNYNPFAASWTLSGTTRVSWYQKGKTRKDWKVNQSGFAGARDSEWQASAGPYANLHLSPDR